MAQQIQIEESKKVLIIEDNKDLQEILKLNFESESIEVLQAFDGLNWLIEMLSKKPDVVLLDLMMPRLDWFELLEILSLRKEIQVPVIICSNIKAEDYKNKKTSSRGDMFIEKADHSGSEIVEKVLEFLNKNSKNNL